MNKKYPKTANSVATLGLLLILSGAGWAMRQNLRSVKSTPPVLAEPVITPPPVDEVLVKRLAEVLRGFTPANQQFALSGTITITDHADSTQNMDRLPFVIGRDKEAFYVRQGNTETLGNAGVLIKIDRRNKKVFVSHPEYVNQPVLIDVAMIRQAVTTENYQLTSRQEGKYQTLNLINEKQFGCRQYTITYDTLHQKVVRIFTRLANPQDPTSRTGEKWVDIHFTQADSLSNLQRYPSAASVLAGNRLSKDYQGYQLINY